MQIPNGWGGFDTDKFKTKIETKDKKKVMWVIDVPFSANGEVNVYTKYNKRKWVK
ncbi:MAG: hypothetical protein K1X81_01510 [Bacteroidia bacterium]|nr:hypothetical protein [Bacteroidia bacterium]